MSPSEVVTVLVVGAGALGREVVQYLRDASLACAGFLDDSPVLRGSAVDGVKVMGRPAEHSFHASERFIVAVGDPAVRRKLGNLLLKAGGIPMTVVHPTAYVARFSTLGQGVVIGPFAYVGPGATIGDHCLLNTYASVGHDATVGQFSVLSPYATLNGSAMVGDGVFLGSKAAILPGIHVGSGSKVSAGAVVTTNVPPAALAAGNPARYRVMFPPW